MKLNRELMAHRRLLNQDLDRMAPALGTTPQKLRKGVHLERRRLRRAKLG